MWRVDKIRSGQECDEETNAPRCLPLCLLYFLLLSVERSNSLGRTSTTVGDILSCGRRRFVVEVGDLLLDGSVATEGGVCNEEKRKWREDEDPDLLRRPRYLNNKSPLPVFTAQCSSHDPSELQE